MLDTWTTLRYRDAYVHHLNQGGGRMELTLAADGHARVACFTEAGAAPTLCAGVLADWVLQELRANLRAMDFPNLPKQAPRKDGDWIALLSVAAPIAMHQVWILRDHRQVAAIDKTVLLLEAVASALSDGLLSAYTPSLRPVLRDGA